MNSRAKGKAGELQFAAYLRENGHVEARRGVQFRGGGDSPDIVGLAGCHVEVKRTERFGLYDALDQARRDSAGTDRLPVVAHRCNDDRRKGSCRGEWIAVLAFDDFLKLLGEAHAERGEP